MNTTSSPPPPPPPPPPPSLPFSPPLLPIFSNIGITYPTKDLTHSCLSPDGKSLAVGGKSGLFIIDLEDPSELKNRFNNKQLRSPPECTTLHWSKDPNILASGVNDVIHIWQCSEDRWNISKSIKAHRRKMSDMSWSETDPGFFCTCAHDNYILVWDVRNPLVEMTGVQHIKCRGVPPPSRLKWNRIDPTKIASVHHGQVNIWDLRNVSLPFAQVIAETNEITSIDWNFKDKDIFLTSSSTDKFKLWSVNKTNESISTEITCKPIEKAYFTPFGQGVAVLFKNCSIQFYNVQIPQVPVLVESFAIPQGAYNQLFFRCSPINEQDEYQIALWSSLESRIQLLPLNHDLVKWCEETIKPRVLPSAAYEESGKSVMTMEEEFDRLQPVFGAFIQKEKSERALLVSFQTNRTSMLIILRMTFPSMYPYGAPPSFIVVENYLDVPSQKITEELVKLSEEMVHKSKNCIQECLKYVSSHFILSHLLLSTTLTTSHRREMVSRSSSGTIPAPIVKKLKELGSKYTTYVVARGDTLATISLKFNMNKILLRDINGLHHSAQLTPGRVIIVMVPKNQCNSSDSINGNNQGQFSTWRKYERSGLLVQTTDWSYISIDEVSIIPELFTSQSSLQNSENQEKVDSPFATATTTTTDTDTDTTTTTTPTDTPTTSPTTLPEYLPPITPISEENRDVLSATSPHLPPMASPSSIVEDENAVLPQSTEPPVRTKSLAVTPVVLNKSDGNTYTLFHTQSVPLKRIIKGKLKYIKVPEFHYVDGIMTLTPSQFIFEPNLDDPLVKQLGVLLLTIVIELSSIAESISIKPTDDNVDIDAMAYLLIATNLAKTTTSPSYKIFYFMAEKERIRKICQSVELWRSEKFEQQLLENLNLERTLMLPRHHQIFKDAFEFLKTRFPKSEDKIPRKELEGEMFEGIGEMLDESLLITEEIFKKLRTALPVRFIDYNWKKIFCTEVDGTSLLTFYSKLQSAEPTVLLLEDSNGYVFGGYCSEAWQEQRDFFGTGECFVFSAKPFFSCYKWTGANYFFMMASKNCISMGGGTSGRTAIYLDSELHWGTSQTSNTFLNRQLSSSEEFTCITVEVYGLVR